MVSIGIDTMRSPCSALNVEVVRNSRQARTNGRSNSTFALNVKVMAIANKRG